jgi:hypothetical protein
MEHGGAAMTESYDGPRAGQEAARLLAAAQDWLRTSAPHLAPVDADGETCACPLCRAVAGVREADPDSVGRWVDAAVAAATSVLAQAGERIATTPSEDGADDDDDDDADGYAAAEPDGPDDSDGSDEDLSNDPGADDDEPTAGSSRQDDDRARGVRRIPLEQQDPGDLDG